MAIRPAPHFVVYTRVPSATPDVTVATVYTKINKWTTVEGLLKAEDYTCLTRPISNHWQPSNDTACIPA